MRRLESGTERTLGYLSDRHRRTTYALVAGERRWLWWVSALEMVAWLATVAAMQGLVRFPVGSLWSLGCAVVVGVQVGRTILLGVRRAGAYREGWLNGRQAMVMAMAEAQRRGMSPQDWLAAELARDLMVAGLAEPESLDGDDQA